MGVSAPDLTLKATPPAPSKQVDGLITGLRAHMKNLGQEPSPEVEAYLAKCLGTGPQVIKQASQRLESSGKAAAKLKVEMAQLTAGWQKFQKQVEEEYEQQKIKFLEKQKVIKEGLAKAEEEYAAAQDALREATAAAEKAVPEDPPQGTPAMVTTMEAKPEGVMTPKRGADAIEVEDDQVIKKLRSPIHVVDSPAGGMNKMDF